MSPYVWFMSCTWGKVSSGHLESPGWALWDGMGRVHVPQQGWAEVWSRTHTPESVTWGLGSAPSTPASMRNCAGASALGLHRVGTLGHEGSHCPSHQASGLCYGCPVLGQLGAYGPWMSHLTKGSVGDNVRETRALVNVLWAQASPGCVYGAVN